MTVGTGRNPRGRKCLVVVITAVSRDLAPPEAAAVLYKPLRSEDDRRRIRSMPPTEDSGSIPGT